MAKHGRSCACVRVGERECVQRCKPWCASRCSTPGSLGKQKALLESFAGFWGVNTPMVTDFERHDITECGVGKG